MGCLLILYLYNSCYDAGVWFKTGADPEGTVRGEGWVGKGVSRDAESIERSELTDFRLSKRQIMLLVEMFVVN